MKTIQTLLAVIFVEIVTARLLAQQVPLLSPLGNYVGGSGRVLVSRDYAYFSFSPRHAVSSFEIVDVSEPANAKRVGGYCCIGIDVSDTRGLRMAISGRFGYAVNGADGLHIIDISVPATPQRVGHLDFISADDVVILSADDVVVRSNLAYVVGNGLKIIDISSPETPRAVGFLDNIWGDRIAISEDHVYLAGGSASSIGGPALSIVDISIPEQPRRVGECKTRDQIWGVTISGRYAYVAEGDSDNSGLLEIFDISDRLAPTLVGRYATSGIAKSAVIAGNYAYIAVHGDGLQVIDIRNPAEPRDVGGNSIFSVGEVAVEAGKLFVATDLEGLLIFNLYTPPPQLRALGWSSQRGMRFSVSGEAGQSVQVQRSSDLIGWQDWFGVVLGPSSSELSDPDTASGPQRFYRAVAQ